MPPSYVNVGAWVGAGTMVDSHVLVGSCAQIGARVHLAAGRHDRRRARAGRARGRSSSRTTRSSARAAPCSRASSSGAGAVIGAGVTLTGTSRLYDLVRGRVLAGDAPSGRSSCRPARVVVPGAGRWPGAFARGARPVGRRSRSWSRTATPARRRAGRPRGGAPMSIATLRRRPRRGRPPARNEILARGPARRARPGRPGRRGSGRRSTSTTSTSSSARSRRCAPSCRRRSSSPTRSRPTRRWPSSRTWVGSGSAPTSPRAASWRPSLAPASTPDRIVMTGPGKRDDELARGRRGRHPRGHGRVARRAGPARAIAAAAGRRQPVMLRAAVTEDAPARARPARRRRRRRQVRDGRRGPRRRPRAARLASPHLELLGLHAFGASNVLDAAALVAHVAATVGAARASWPDAAGTPLRLVDAGGGLGIPYEAARGVARPRSARARGWREIIAGWAARPAPARTRGSCSSPAASSSGRPARTSRASSIARPSTARSWSSSTAASTTCSGRRSSARSTGSGRSAAPTAPPRRPAPAGHRRRPAVLRPRRVQPGRGHDPARGRRPGGRPRRRRLRLHRVDAALPVAPDPGRGRRPRRRAPRSSGRGSRPRRWLERQVAPDW